MNNQAYKGKVDDYLVKITTHYYGSTYNRRDEIGKYIAAAFTGLEKQETIYVCIMEELKFHQVGSKCCSVGKGEENGVLYSDGGLYRQYCQIDNEEKTIYGLISRQLGKKAVENTDFIYRIDLY